jgi:hypothetical protein
VFSNPFVILRAAKNPAGGPKHLRGANIEMDSSLRMTGEKQGLKTLPRT